MKKGEKKRKKKKKKSGQDLEYYLDVACNNGNNNIRTNSNPMKA